MRQLGWGFMSASVALAGLSVFGLMALRQPDIPHDVLDRKYADPRSAFLEGPHGAKIHYRDEGRRDRPTLLLVHGYCASLHTWQPWVERLRDSYRIVSIDLPGHGLTRTPPRYRVTRNSFADVIEATAEHLKLDRFTLIGNSMGGAAAWDYASRRPERVEALVLVAAAGFTPRPDQDYLHPAVQDLMRSPMGPILRDLDNTPFMRKGLKASFADQGLADDRMIERYVELARAPMHRDVQMQLAINRDERLYASRQNLTRIKAPTLVLHGTHDRVVPVTDGLRFASLLPNSHLIMYEEIGHIVQEEIPEQSVGDLIAFLEEVVQPRVRERPALRLVA